MSEPKDRPGRQSGEENQRQRLLREGTSAIVGDIAAAVVIKDEDLFFLSDAEGQVPQNKLHGFGLYYHDCRYLSGYAFTIADQKPVCLMASGDHGFAAIYQFTNPELELGKTRIHREWISMRWERLLDGKSLALHDRVILRNFSLETVRFPLSIGFAADFQDVFNVRDQIHEITGRHEAPRWNNGLLCFAYDGKDGIRRTLSIALDPAPDECGDRRVTYPIELDALSSTVLSITIKVGEAEPQAIIRPDSRPGVNYQIMRERLQNSSDAWLARETGMLSDSLVLNRIMEQSQRALGVLQTRVDGHTYFAAGVPWFVALFGRDSLITALQTLAYDPHIAEQTLYLLAQYQGQRDDGWREEEPGKILHELRVGEKAKLGEIPHIPYYGTIDATLLFLILLGRHATWTGELTLFRKLEPCADAALRWMTSGRKVADNRYLAYQRRSEAGLENQGWKDSGDGIVNRDGTLATPPIALVEVQAYAYEAMTLMSDLYLRAGDAARATQLREDAAALRSRFNHDYWVEDTGCYALALQAGDQPAAVVSSNAGHALWSGIADADKAGRVAEALMSKAMFSGWGVRTLSEQERRYNPMGYHLGTVWPHDNSLIAAGFRRYGHDDSAMRVFRGLIEAAMHFEGNQLPELFCGFPREDYPVPVKYPVACHPQAWASAAVPYLLQSVLGIEPDAFAARLRITRPMLPDFLGYIELHGLRLGQASVDLRFERTGDRVSVDVLGQQGELELMVDS